MRIWNGAGYNASVERTLRQLLLSEQDPELKVKRQTALDNFYSEQRQKRLLGGSPVNTPLNVPYEEREALKAAAGPNWRNSLYWNKACRRWEVLPFRSLLPFQKWLE